MPGAWIVGRNLECDYVVDQPPVSGCHCRVTQDGFRIFLEDLGSRNGTYINGEKIPVASRHPLDLTDRVNLGTHAIDPAELIAFVERMSPPELVFRGGKLIVGRSADCELVIDLPSISSRHLRVFRSGDRTYVEDLASANGTFVNDQRIQGRREVRTGDRISLAGRTLAFREELPVASPSRSEKTEILDPSPSPPESERPSSRAGEVLLEESISVERPPSSDGRRGDRAARSIPTERWAALLVQAPVLGLLAGGLAHSRGAGDAQAVLLFGLVIASLWFGLGDAVLGETVEPAGPLYARGDSVKPRALRFGPSIAPIGLVLVQCLLAWLVAGVAGGLGTLGAALLGFLCACGCVGLLAGGLIVATVPGRIAAIGCVVAILIVAFSLGGLIRPIHSLPGWVRLASSLTPTRWAFEGALVVSAGESALRDGSLPLTEAYFPAETIRMGAAADALALGLMLVGMAAFAAFLSRPWAFRGS